MFELFPLVFGIGYHINSINRMPLEEAIATFSYLVSELDKLGVSYICLVRYLPYVDAEYDGRNRYSLFLFNRRLTILIYIKVFCARLNTMSLQLTGPLSSMLNSCSTAL